VEKVRMVADARSQRTQKAQRLLNGGATIRRYVFLEGYFDYGTAIDTRPLYPLCSVARIKEEV
jgi:hypothetical protein